jgi:hypothetical protein
MITHILSYPLILIVPPKGAGLFTQAFELQEPAGRFMRRRNQPWWSRFQFRRLFWLIGWVGSSWRRINRTPGKLQRLSLIRLEDQKFIILDRRGLAKMVEL